jgi:hypothetical protein
MTVYLADEHAQRLVLVVKMTTVLEEYTTEEQLSVVRFFLWENELYAKDVHKKVSCLRWKVFFA